MIKCTHMEWWFHGKNGQSVPTHHWWFCLDLFNSGIMNNLLIILFDTLHAIFTTCLWKNTQVTRRHDTNCDYDSYLGNYGSNESSRGPTNRKRIAANRNEAKFPKIKAWGRTETVVRNFTKQKEVGTEENKFSSHQKVITVVCLTFDVKRLTTGRISDLTAHDFFLVLEHSHIGSLQIIFCPNSLLTMNISH